MNEKDKQRLAKIESLISQHEIYWVDQEHWTGGQMKTVADAEDDIQWLINQLKDKQ